MFVGVARLTLQISDSGSLKSKRQVLRRVTDRVKARFNVVGGRGRGPRPLAAGHHRPGGGEQRPPPRGRADREDDPLRGGDVRRSAPEPGAGDPRLRGPAVRPRRPPGRREHARAALRPRGPQPGRGRGAWPSGTERPGALVQGRPGSAGWRRPQPDRGPGPGAEAPQQARLGKIDERPWPPRAGGGGDPGRGGRAPPARRAPRPAHRLHHHHRGEDDPRPPGGAGLLVARSGPTPSGRRPRPGWTRPRASSAAR